MPIMDYLERNRREYGDEVALIELNPEQKEKARQQINYLIYLVDKALETLKQG